MAAILIGAAGAAALAAGVVGMASRKHTYHYAQQQQHAAPDMYVDHGDDRQSDPYELKHTMYEDRHSSPGYEDQDWQLDCSSKDSCEGFRTPGDGRTPFEAPTWGQVSNRTVRDLGTHEPGSFIDQIEMESDRDASVELELPPERTVNYTSHPLDWGGQLTPEEMPYGASEATDLQFWGPEDWDAYRHSKRPAYLDNSANYKDGKEINRPLDDFGPSWGPDEGGEGAHQWGLGSGEYTARDAGPRLLARNLYNRHVTTREYKRPLLLPPTPGAAVGGGNPGLEADVTFGERVSRLFSAFMPWKSAMPGTMAPPEYAEHTVDKSRRLLYDPGLGVAAARGGQMAYGGPGVNPVQGGRMRQTDDTLSLPMGNAAAKVSAHGGLNINPVQGGRMRQTDDALSLPMGNVTAKVAARGDLSINPYEGYHYTSRETMEGPAISRRGQGGNGYLLLGQYQEYRPRKMPSDMQDYVGPKGGAKTGTYGGEAAHGISFPNVKSESTETHLTIGGRGGRGLLGRAGIVTLGHNASVGERGADYDDSPIPEQLINLRTPLAKAMQVDGRSQQALDDLFTVQHS